jgi:hypothetical protein
VGPSEHGRKKKKFTCITNLRLIHTFVNTPFVSFYLSSVRQVKREYDSK